MRIAMCFILLTSCAVFAVKTNSLKLIEDTKTQTLIVRDGDIDVMTYRFGDQLKKSVNPKYTRSGYIHPLNGPAGQVLTDDFPKDHYHHRGIGWAWPRMKARGRTCQTWHPSPLRQYFVKWVNKKIKNGVAILHVENEWKLDGKEKVAKEFVKLTVHPATKLGRAIDIELTFEAVGGTVELLGAEKKGYGGLCIRGAPLFKGKPLTTDQGPLKKDSTNIPYRWADMSTDQVGVSVFVAPDHPDFPPTWLLRNSYAGILNVSWPGLKPYVLQPGQPIKLTYRLYIHQGNVKTGQVKQAYKNYLAELRKSK